MSRTGPGACCDIRVTALSDGIFGLVGANFVSAYSRLSLFIAVKSARVSAVTEKTSDKRASRRHRRRRFVIFTLAFPLLPRRRHGVTSCRARGRMRFRSTARAIVFFHGRNNARRAGSRARRHFISRSCARGDVCLSTENRRLHLSFDVSHRETFIAHPSSAPRRWTEKRGAQKERMNE